jgi:hypothetical protein
MYSGVAGIGLAPWKVITKKHKFKIDLISKEHENIPQSGAESYFRVKY